MNFIFKSVVMLFFSITLTSVHADEKKVRQALAESMPSLEINSVKPSEVKGLFEVMAGANIFYVSEDGKYIIQGSLYDLQNRIDLTEKKLAGARVASLDKIGQDKKIIFKPENSLYKISVFTDIDCGYCRKLHSEIDQYMQEGIEVDYLFYPRAGKGSDSYNKAITVWCSKDRNAALTEAKKGNKLEPKTCDNPVDQHMALAHEFGVKGTPMLVTEKGNIFPGYIPAKELVKALKSEKEN
jgi:thiol:disulfide interchange protein DsbC